MVSQGATANTRNRDRVCLFWTAENVELSVLKTIMANLWVNLKDHCSIFLDAVSIIDFLTVSSVAVKLIETQTD